MLNDTDTLADRLKTGDRAALARAITLVESRKSEHQETAQALLENILPETGKAVRLGITGVPGVGKSTVIDQLGINLIDQGHRVAVLAVDPSSTRTGGSILGDKTRMARLSVSENAFIRPSPSAGTLGGVAAKTREAMLLCEAAGYDVIIVETVGTGQSETAVSDMVDFFAVLMLPGGGDELQGIKKGVIEIADLIAVNKADGDNIKKAENAAAEYSAALHILTPASPDWTPAVVTISGLNNRGLDLLWDRVIEHRTITSGTNAFETKRRAQSVRWMWSMIDDSLRQRLQADVHLRSILPEIEEAVATKQMTPREASVKILKRLGLT
ncbi:MAG: methylmalonyl Co-A mutase-associated GTPase MeaB [Hyphomicrobiales bacterium]|nr:methylmalonyl Co-A mutase-associated GTPase MeaB [Hyphomicrobiales bacterium]